MLVVNYRDGLPNRQFYRRVFVTSTVPATAADIQFCYESKPGGTCGLMTAVQNLSISLARHILYNLIVMPI